MSEKYFGKYRAIVVDIKDPEERGRVKVKCPHVLGEYRSAWCEICVPYASEYDGDFQLPPVDERVWIEFEEGDPMRPILVGGWYGKFKSPKQGNYKNDAKNVRTIQFRGAKIELRGDWKYDLGSTIPTHIKLESDTLILTCGGVTCTLSPSSLQELKRLIGG